MKTLAIIGTGIAGLGCAWFLHQRFDLTLFEQQNYAGGHSHTVTVREGEREVPIDTGFMVFNQVTYPLLTRLFRELDVATKPTSMSFSVQHTPSGLEYNGASLNLLFGQRRNLLRPSHWRMLAAINRFNAEAVAALEDPQWAECILREYVAIRGYGNEMLDLYLVPMSSAVWSTPPERMLDFPAMTLIRFWHNHGFLGLHTQHPWFTVVDGSRSYVRKISAPFKDRICLEQPAVRVCREGGHVKVTLASGEARTFDKVILACHGDQALALLEDPTEQERRLLSEFAYQPNSVTVHTDASFMPRTRRCWASWNYRIDVQGDGRLLPTTHYWMNSLQGVSDRENYFVSLNCQDRIAPEKILRRLEYEHPLFSLGAIRAQKELPGLNLLSPDQTTYYAGAWFKYGFHEDGFASALACARGVTGESLWA
jgi:predicted NAD/FAD-binding protein